MTSLTLTIKFQRRYDRRLPHNNATTTGNEKYSPLRNMTLHTHQFNNTKTEPRTTDPNRSKHRTA